MCRRPAKKPDKSSKIAHLRLNRASLLDDATASVATQLVTEPEPVALSWLPDTGSDVDAIGTQHLDQLGGFVKNLLDDIDDVRTGDGASLTPVGKISATLSCGPNQHTSTIHVYDGLSDALLSRSSLHVLGYLPSGWPKQIAAVQQVVPPVVPDAPADKVVSKATDSETMRAELLAEFADVFDDSVLKPMLGGPMEIRVRADAKPVAVYHARQILHAYRDQVKSHLDDMVRDAINEEVTEPSAWCHPIVIVDKKGTNEKRLTVDFKKLNDQVERPAHPAPSPRVAVSSIGNARYFTKLDARHGYWQVTLSEASHPLTTFMTHWGRYRYLRNPQGLVSAGDEFNHRTDTGFAHISQFQKVVHDCLIYGNDLPTHRSHVRDVLLCSRENGITLSANKFVFGMPAIEFCGYRISADGWTVVDAKVKAISQFPAPSNRTDLRSFTGLISQCGEFTPHLSEHAAPLCPLLKTSNEFVWDSVHTDTVNAAKAELLSPSTLSFFQRDQPLRLETDASALHGLGYVLWQLQDGKWRILQCGSRFLSDPESWYAVIELELLAVVWAVKKCSLYLPGTLFEVATDHRPLTSIINSYSLDQIENFRLQRLVMKLCPYQLHATWRKGTDNAFADALSRNPVDDPTPDDELGEHPALRTPVIRACIREDTEGQIANLQFAELQEAARADSDYQALLVTVRNGFPDDKRDVCPAAQPYWTVCHHLTVNQDLVLKGPRIVVPRSLRRSVLDDLHAAHQGLNHTKARAPQVGYWPQLSNDIDNIVRSCAECRHHAPFQVKELLLATEDRCPALLFESTSADLFK